MHSSRPLKARSICRRAAAGAPVELIARTPGLLIVVTRGRGALEDGATVAELLGGQLALGEASLEDVGGAGGPAVPRSAGKVAASRSPAPAAEQEDHPDDDREPEQGEEQEPPVRSAPGGQGGGADERREIKHGCPFWSPNKWRTQSLTISSIYPLSQIRCVPRWRPGQRPHQPA